jgi:hypothetical protein
MMHIPSNPDAAIAIDIGGVFTRAFLFDIVEGEYRYIASGTAPSTLWAPIKDVRVGVRLALQELQEITGYSMVSQDGKLEFLNSQVELGVDSISMTISAGPPLKLVLVGLIKNTSVASATRLAKTTLNRIEDVICLKDPRKIEEIIDSIVRGQPDLIIISGGTENGAEIAPMRLVEIVRLACMSFPRQQRPEVLFAGNQKLAREISSKLVPSIEVHFGGNIRRTSEVEDFEPAMDKLSRIHSRNWKTQVNGLEQLGTETGAEILTTPKSFGRIIRFLSKVHQNAKGILGVDLGYSSTTLAAANSGKLNLAVNPLFGYKCKLQDFIKLYPIKKIASWLSLEVSDDYIFEYLANKFLYPTSVPEKFEDLAIEQSLARLRMFEVVQLVLPYLQKHRLNGSDKLLPYIELIIASGSVLTDASNFAQSVMMLLDGLQPIGVTSIILDKNKITSSLGAAAEKYPNMVIQVLNSNAYIHLGTVISPVGQAPTGTPILRIKMTNENMDEKTLEINQGDLKVIPLSQGSGVELQLHPLHLYDVGMGAPGRGGLIKAVGGIFGVIIDARGRPINIEQTISKEYQNTIKWIQTLSG